MPDQADQLRALVQRTVDARPVLGPGLPIVVVSGGATGVGATTLALQLARELARLGKPAVLVDANLACPQSLPIGIGTRGSLADLLDGSRSAVEIVEQIGDGVHLLPARAQGETQIDLSHESVGRLLSQLRGLHTMAEVAIVDAGHGMTPWVERWWRAAQQVFLVTTAAEAAVKDSYRTLKLAPWGDADGKVRLVVNQCDERASGEAVTSRFVSTCRRFLGLHIDGAPAIACQQPGSSADDAFHQSVRLLATEVVTASLVLGGRIKRRSEQRAHRVAELLALPEFSINSTNNTQSSTE